MMMMDEGIMLEEFREFLEDNNLAPPAPLQRANPEPSLSFWSPADPALENESSPGLTMTVHVNQSNERTVRFQRVVYDIRYALSEVEETTRPERPGVSWIENEVELGDVPDLFAAYELAKAWLGGASARELPVRRRPLV